LSHEIEQAMMSFNLHREMKLRELYAAATGRYNYHPTPDCDLAALNPDITLMPFETWLRHRWDSIPVEDA
jgi:hypothetical protein